VNSGDTFTATVSYLGGSLFALPITDLTTTQTYSGTYNAVAQRQSAEWIVEAPSSSIGVLPLANFGTVNFASAQFTDNTGSTYAVDGRGPGTYATIALDDPNGGSAEPSSLLDISGSTGPSSFNVTYAGLSVGISPTSVSLDIGQSQVFTSDVSGGAPPYIYQWYQNGTQVSGAYGSTWKFTAVSAASYMVYLEVNDSAGIHAKSNTVTVTVNMHDVAITIVTPSKTVVGLGYDTNITVTTADLGSFPETFNVTVFADALPITSINVTLSTGNSTDVKFSWNTTGVVYGNYNVSAYAWPVPGETNTANNNCTGGLVTVSIPGDINGNFNVNLSDLVLFAKAYNTRPGDAKWNSNADINGDGTVGLPDLVIMARHYNTHYP
jgi:hypothetical protein